MPGTTVLFLGHETSPESRAAFDHLRQTAGGADVRWLLDTARAPVVPQDLESSIIRSDSRRFSEWGFAVHGATMLPGHCHFPVLNYAQQNPGFDWLWTVEYDVRFTGPWRLLFDHFAPCDADLLTCHLRSRRQEPRWHWWDTLQAPEGEVVDAASVLRAFMVVARYSARALATIAAMQSSGWRGHQEVIVPTLLARTGMRLRDLNDSSGLPSSRRFYTSRGGSKGKLRHFGTVRYRPVRARAGWRRNKLYHPVKPAGMIESPVRS